MFKGQWVKFLLPLSLLLSLFSFSGAVSLSSFQPKKYATEFLWSGEYKSSSVHARYCCYFKSPAVARYDFLLKGYELGLRLMYDRLISLKINYLADQFAGIKSIILYEIGFESLLKILKMPAIVLLNPCRSRHTLVNLWLLQ